MRHENPFCALLAENPKSLAVCLQAHEDMVRHTGDLPSTITSPFGLTETAVPLKLGVTTIGHLHVRDERVGRYRVDVSHWEPRHAEVLVFSFTPLQRSSQ